MGKDEIKLEDVEEGEISDSASIEEISEEDFNKQEVKILKESKSSKGGEANSNSRVWTMQDLCKYPSVIRGYASGLYNFAWAQAVQNKPLNDIFVKELEQQPQQDENNNSKRSSPSSSVASVNSKEEKGYSGNSADRVVIDDDTGDEMEEDKIVNLDKEEGELEEGEIDLDSEPVKERVLSSEDGNVGISDELEKRVSLIRGVLEGITVIEAEKSFEVVCSRLQNALESLRGLVFEYGVPTKDTLIELALGAVNSAFVALNSNLKEQNVSILSRLLSVVKSFDPPLFPLDKMKEIEVMLLSLNSPARAIDSEKEIKIVNKKDPDALAENVGHDLTVTNKLPLSVDSEIHNMPNMLTEALKPGVPNFRNKGLSLPLLDLHKDHDADSLPSPTRETTPCLPVLRPLTTGDGMVRSGLMMAKGLPDEERNKMHPYETDALKAFSSYQRKFGRGSFFSSDRLPSPTPSDESGDEGCDTGGEVSSSSSIGNFKPNLPVMGHPIVSSPPHIDSASSTSSMQGQFTTQNATPVTVSSASNILSKTSAKSRDPRLRFANSNVSALDLNQRPLHNASKVPPVSGIMDPRKKKSTEESVLDGPAPKRQKNELENFGVRDVQVVSGNGGWLEDTDNCGSQMTNRNQTMETLDSNSRKMEHGVTCSSTLSGKTNTTVNKNEQVPLTGMSNPSLPALLKDIAVNPTMLINILKMGQQQRLPSESQQKTPDPLKNTLYQPSSNPVLGVVPPSNVIPSPSVNAVPSSSSGTLSKPAGNLQGPPLDESGKIRMKPRDPRRVLHGNVLQKSSSVGPDQLKTNGTSPASSTQGSKDNMNAQKQLENQIEAKPIQCQLVPPPDIAQQFTQSLKNIAGMMSGPQSFASLPAVSQNLVSQPIQVKSETTDKNTKDSNCEDQQTGTGTAPEVGVTCPPPSQNAWGDVEHLFEKYDDRQKAAIQRERARRIEEQKKMFAARKLCLVLDLDHTLLNSAKFIEVDPVHEEILRKKEEQDREKPQRHLFRFHHMGMWTKLRPGIWNFLEKASKLYELHLYTMGNKLYATEMAKVLDPKGVLFAGRVISRGDDGDPFDGDERVPRSKDLEGVLGMESSVVIIDDSVRVWPHNKLNLIVVERYTYFPCSRRQFGLLGPSLLEIDHDERPEDGTLASSLAVIERIHQNFFSHQNLDDLDVRNILATEQRKILSGCRIVFSRVFPVGEANPHLHPLWQTAEQFGAVCTNQIDEHVTHVVANSLGTDKVNWALSTGKFVVHPGWVEASALLYRRANEHDFAIKP
ncbi:hypothetical protein J1N35_041837 [Gossypium stocksii]|uniref:protein-serine/threonine phosphatase n=1 Tax=Gossypium stocksii TaxID=47602 RepID=A0A9D3ZK17_9ROSI|nr:hypothetical protein J1N35_041837 [Gossypium stocksii]